MQHARILAFVAVLCAARIAGATLTKVDSFGANPGALAMYEYVPANLPANRPLVVVLHGCTQTAANMENAGWNTLADTYQFAVVYPEQQTANNSVRCFNWAGEFGDPTNLERGKGENQSIVSMIDAAIAAHGSDASKVYLVGFSAGGAFAAVLLATFPERFAAAAIMSGLPYRCATTVNGAFSCQSPGITKTAAQWGDLVRAAFTFSGTRAPIQLWHGANDSIVVPANQGELIKQWTNVFGTDDTADDTEQLPGATRTVYKAGTKVVLEAYRVDGMGHATAVGDEASGTCPAVAGSYFESKGICATFRAAKFFGLVGGGGGTDAAPPTVAIVSPAGGSEVTGAVTVVVAANDDTAMNSVALTIDGAEVGAPDTEAPYQFAWDATAAGPGDHQLIATATDKSGNISTAMAMVTVPGPGGGGGGGGGGDDDGNNPSGAELPGCSLDAGGGGGRLASLGWIALAFVVLRSGRARRRR